MTCRSAIKDMTACACADGCRRTMFGEGYLLAHELFCQVDTPEEYDKRHKPREVILLGDGLVKMGDEDLEPDCDLEKDNEHG